MTRYGEDEADDLFRADAERLGYFTPDPVTGQVRGIYQYYADFGLVQPQRYEKIVRAREITGLDIERILDGPA